MLERDWTVHNNQTSPRISSMAASFVSPQYFMSSLMHYSQVFSVLGTTLNCIHIFIVTGSFLYWCVMRPASQRFFIHSCICQRFLALIAFLCWCAVKQSINQSISGLLASACMSGDYHSYILQADTHSSFALHSRWPNHLKRPCFTNTQNTHLLIQLLTRYSILETYHTQPSNHQPHCTLQSAYLTNSLAKFHCHTLHTNFKHFLLLTDNFSLMLRFSANLHPSST